MVSVIETVVVSLLLLLYIIEYDKEWNSSILKIIGQSSNFDRYPTKTTDRFTSTFI